MDCQALSTFNISNFTLYQTNSYHLSFMSNKSIEMVYRSPHTANVLCTVSITSNLSKNMVKTIISSLLQNKFYQSDMRNFKIRKTLIIKKTYSCSRKFSCMKKIIFETNLCIQQKISCGKNEKIFLLRRLFFVLI